MSKQDPDVRTQEYHYETADIRERKGHVPFWLIIVTIGLLTWGVYYLVFYWHPP